MESPRLDSVKNAIWYLLTHHHLLEGRYDPGTGTYRNWDRSYTVRPAKFPLPTSEEEIREAVLGTARVGAVGAGHSFNDLHLNRGALISLDRYAGLLRCDVRQRTATFRAGTRVRDVTRTLRELGLALEVLPDHNAQSLGGILATDVHASGRLAHVSQAVSEIRLIDGYGVFHTLGRDHPLFRATIGGMGCTGIVVEVTLECVDPFRLETRAFRCTWDELLANLDTWRDENELLAAGYLPSIDACVVEVKNRTQKPLTSRGPQKETLRHVTEAIAQSLALPRARGPYGLRRSLARAVLSQSTKHLREHSALVLESFEGFNRNVYQVHTEAEFTVPQEDARAVLERGYELMQRRPRDAYYLLGIRMSRCNPHTLIGPGAGPPGRKIAWIAPHLDGREIDREYDREWADIFQQFDARPHYGKNLLGLGSDYLARVHGKEWTEFLRLVHTYDPRGKFANALIDPTLSVSCDDTQAANKELRVGARRRLAL